MNAQEGKEGFELAWDVAERAIGNTVDLSRTNIMRRIRSLGLLPAYFNEKDILDLGAGNNNPEVDGYTEVFQPWFCRVMQALGARPVACDIGPNTNESFESHQINLLQLAHRERALAAMLNFRKFDLIHSHRFLANHAGSDDPWHPRKRNESPSILHAQHTHPDEVSRLRMILPKVALRQLKAGGSFFWEHLEYAKKKGKLTLIRDDVTVL